ncbi:MAG: hypothetical protein ACH255_03140 [Candidatus Thiodiazotropha sp.]
MTTKEKRQCKKKARATPASEWEWEVAQSIFILDSAVGLIFANLKSTDPVRATALHGALKMLADSGPPEQDVMDDHLHRWIGILEGRLADD